MSSKPETEMNETEMNEETVRKILYNHTIINDKIYDPQGYLIWGTKDFTIDLDGEFNIRSLEAIVWWMRNKNTL